MPLHVLSLYSILRKRKTLVRAMRLTAIHFPNTIPKTNCTERGSENKKRKESRYMCTVYYVRICVVPSLGIYHQTSKRLISIAFHKYKQI